MLLNCLNKINPTFRSFINIRTALAAVAVTGGAFAQATMTGAIAYGFQSDTTSSNVTTSGFGMEDAEINFAVSEDLEGVGKLSAGLGIWWGGRSTGAYSGDSNITLALSGGMKIVMKSAQAAEYLTGGIAGAGANFEADLTKTALLSRTNNDSVSVSLPIAEGTTLSVSHSEPDVVIGTGSAANVGILQTTTATAATVQPYDTVVLGYKAGGLVVDAQYRTYGRQETNNTVYANTKNRLSASYDLGAAKIGAGVDTTMYTYGNSNTKTLVGITIPMGSLTLGAQMLNVTASGNATSTSNYTRTGALAGGMYSLSKRTYLTGQYYTSDVGGTSNQNGYLFSMYNTF
jgi:hypothetical protein